MDKANYTVSLYNENHEASLRKFVEYFWATDSSANTRIEQSGQSNATKEKSEKMRPPTFLFLKDDEVLGHIATIPVRLLIHSRIISAHWVVGFMVMPEYRNGPIGPLLIKKVNETIDFAMTLHVENNVLRIFKGLGWKHPGVIPQFIQVIDAYRLLKEVNIERLKGRNDVIGKCLVIGLSNTFTRFLLAFFASIALKIWSLGTSVIRPRCGPYEVVEEYSFDASYDALWEEVGGKFDATVVRDGKYLENRFGSRLERYRLLACRKNKRLIGYCILKVKAFHNDPRMGNARVGTLVDCLFNPEDFSGLQLLFFEAKKTFKNEKVDAIFCTASFLPLRNFLMKNGFIKVPGNLNFAFHGSHLLEPLEDLRLSEWHIMRGDADADQNF
jgi:hypothetical protein